jgi:hypothetical protein
MGLPDTTSRMLYRVRKPEVLDSSATITVMKTISFRSILLRPSYCAHTIRSPDFKPPCYRWNRRICWATVAMDTNRKPSRIVLRENPIKNHAQAHIGCLDVAAEARNWQEVYGAKGAELIYLAHVHAAYQVLRTTIVRYPKLIAWPLEHTRLIAGLAGLK